VRDSILAWVRRGLAVGVLAALFLPMVTFKGCGENDPKITYSGWTLVWESPTLVSIPLFAVVAAGLTFVNRRVRSAVGRHILALLKIAFAGAAGIWTFWAFAIWSATMTVWTEIGTWLILGACLGTVVCDLVEAAASWIAWRRWKRSRAIPLLEDSLVRVTGLGNLVLEPLLVAVVVIPSAVFLVQEGWPPACA